MMQFRSPFMGAGLGMPPMGGPMQLGPIGKPGMYPGFNPPIPFEGGGYDPKKRRLPMMPMPINPFGGFRMPQQFGFGVQRPGSMPY